jgi:V-type H+-transporting ATPase subunit a
MPIGVDPAWFRSQNHLTFTNNLKLKMAVIFGVSHMSLGILMKALNSIHFGRWIEFFFEFIPQIILLWCLFGFMDILIVIKWLYAWNDRENPTTDPPSIITIMINMFLFRGKVEEGTEPLLGSESTQQIVCVVLVIVAIC